MLRQRLTEKKRIGIDPSAEQQFGSDRNNFSRCHKHKGKDKESRNALEMILQVHAEAEKFDAVGLEFARYRLASVQT